MVEPEKKIRKPKKADDEEIYWFGDASLKKRKRRNYGVCISKSKGGCKINPKCEATSSDECEDYESIQPFIPPIDINYNLNLQIAETLAYGLSGNDNMLLVGPPGCLSGKTKVRLRRGKRNTGRDYTIEEAYKKFHYMQTGKRPWEKGYKTKIQSLLEDGTINYLPIEDIIYQGIKETYLIKMKSGKTIKATADHRFKVSFHPKRDIEGFVRLEQLSPGDEILCHNRTSVSSGRSNKYHGRATISCKYHPHGRIKYTLGYKYKEVYASIAIAEAAMNGISIQEFISIIKTEKHRASTLKYIPNGFVVHHKDTNVLNNDITNLQIITKRKHDIISGKILKRNFSVQLPRAECIVSIKEYGEEPVYDISMQGPPNFVADGFIVHNCGKSSLVMTIAAITDWELVRFSCSEETRQSQVIGQWIVVGDKMKWVDGYVTDALRNGKILLEDEADFMRPELRGALHPMLENNGTITLQNYHPQSGEPFLEVLDRHPNFRWISTANTTGLGDDSFLYHGTQFMNAAARDRYNVIIPMMYLSIEEETEIITKKTPLCPDGTLGIDENVARKMAQTAHGIRQLFDQQKVQYTFSMRRLLAWARYHAFYCRRNPAEAVKLSLLSFARDDDVAKLIEIIRLHMGSDFTSGLETITRGSV